MDSDLSLRNRHNPDYDHPDWRAHRPAGGREFSSLQPKITRSIDDGHLFRPADFAVWRAALDDVDGPFSELHAEGWTETIADFHRMLDAMEVDPDLWARYGH